MSFLTQSHQVFFGRPLCLIPSTSHVIQRLTPSLSCFRSTCTNHLNLLFLIIKLTGSNPKSYLSSLFFLSISLTPHIRLIIYGHFNAGRFPWREQKSTSDRQDGIPHPLILAGRSFGGHSVVNVLLS